MNRLRRFDTATISLRRNRLVKWVGAGGWLVMHRDWFRNRTLSAVSTATNIYLQISGIGKR